jgi:hypothetical protein
MNDTPEINIDDVTKGHTIAPLTDDTALLAYSGCGTPLTERASTFLLFLLHELFPAEYLFAMLVRMTVGIVEQRARHNSMRMIQD